MGESYLPRQLYNPAYANRFTMGKNKNTYVQINNYANGYSSCQKFTQSQWDAYSRRYGGLAMNPMYYQTNDCCHGCSDSGMPDWMLYGKIGLDLLGGLKDLFKPSTS